jgi:uncharacterized protein (TIGR03546 family)
MIGLIARTLKVLNSETAPGQIGAGVAFACLLGFTPLWTLHNAVVLLLVLFLRANLSIFIVAWGLFTLLAFALDPAFDAVGHAILTAGGLQPMWSAFYATDLGRLSEFNNTVVMGSLLVGLVAAPVLWFATVQLVRQYRSRMLDWLRRKRVFQVLAGTRLFVLYQSLAR